MEDEMLRKALTITCLFLFFAGTCAGLSQEELDKRKRVKYAIRNGIIDIYDVSFETYVKLEMWDEIGFIFEANNKNMIRHTFPGMYYSRPYIVRGAVWVFENASGAKRGIYVFDPDTLRLVEKLTNRRYEKYEGGVRKVYHHTVISGGSDIDVDACVIWNTKTDEIRKVRLQDGHYIGSVEVENGVLYVGSCGGLVNAWNYDTLKFVRKYSSSNKENISWNIFNEKECITSLKIAGDRLIGVGEKTVFIWAVSSGKLLKSYEKRLHNAAVSFYGDYIIEYKNDKFAVRHLKDGQLVKMVQTENPVEDLIVTPERILEKHGDELLILALRHNRGLLIYDFKTLRLMKKIRIHGETLTAYKNAVFATDDKNIYRYDIVSKNGEKYESFLQTVRAGDIHVDSHTYYQLLKQLYDYPDILEMAGISEKFLDLHGLSLRHSFKYGRIGERLISEEGDEEKGYTENVYGYKVFYEVENKSDNYYFVSLGAQWSGEYGKNSSRNNDEDWDAGAGGNRGFLIRDFFMTPHDNRHKDSFEVGEKEPVNLSIYPLKIEKISRVYYEEFMKALKGRVDEISLIDKYIGDDLVKSWHGELKEKRKKLLGEEKKFFWFFNND